MSLINYHGDSKILKRICALLNVKDVQDGQGHSLVDQNGIAIVSGGGGGSSTLAGLSDVDTAGVTAGDALCYNGTSQKWEDKTLAAVAMSGSYNDLSNTPTIPAAQVNSDWNASSGVAEILNKPTLATVATSGSYNDLSNTPTIPDELADLADDSTHRVVTDSEKTAWSAKVDDNPTFSEASTRANIASGESFATILGKIKKYFTDLATVAFSGSYNDLTNQPTIPSVSANPATTTATLTGIEIDGTNYAVQGGSANVQSDWNQTDTTADDYIKNKPSLAAVATSGSYNDLSNTPTIPAAQVNSDWTAASGVSQILNKPSLATVATSGSYSDLSNKPTIPAAVAVKGNEESSYRTGNVNLTPANIGAIPLFQSGGLASCSGNGQNSYFKIATLTITGGYVNGPVSFELSQRQYEVSLIQVSFASNSGTDPGLGYFVTSSNDNYYIKKAATSKWELYGKYSETWGGCILHRVFGYRANNGVSVTVNMTNAGTTAPSDTTQASVIFDSRYNFANVTGGGSVSVAVSRTGPTYTYALSGTDQNVTQTNTTGQAAYRLLYSATADSTTRTEGARKGKLLVNPYHNAIFGESGQKLYLGGSDETTYWVYEGVWSGTWSLNPNGDDKLYLGQSGARWRTVYAVNGSINTSDRNKKKDIVELDDFAKDFIMALKPVSYKRLDGDRTHYGMIAQDVEDSMTEFGMTSMDFAGLCKDTKDEEYYEEEVRDDGSTFKMLKHRKIEGEFDYGLRYEEFIAPLIKTVQIQQAEIEELKRRIETLEKMGG